jgi:2,3-bisphosphoglycerate-independent phosphoglycerate mutase
MLHERAVPRRPAILIILDGFGVNPSRLNNAWAEADTPNLDRHFAHNPHTTLLPSGLAVGLPEGQMGNSEVGHITLGSGSVIMQDLVRIDMAIEDGSFFEKNALLRAIEHAKEDGRPMHLVGLVSDGGVHSHISHLLALIELCRRHGVRPLVHMITDGRDTPPRSALNYLPALEMALVEADGVIATICGRYYAMDRDRRWERTYAAFDAVTRGVGRKADGPTQAIQDAYEAGEADEFIKPVVLPGFGPVRPDDQMIFFNFRNDRPRQLAAALGQDEFAGFDRGDYEPVVVTCLTQYDPQFLSPIVFKPQKPEITLGEVISQRGYRQFRCAETEKYAHVTFFFNGGKEAPFAGEKRVMVPSPKVATYDLCPEMSAREVADEVVRALQSGKFSFVLVNFANGDMVGHTAVREAIIQAVETLDREVGRVLDCAVEQGYSVVLTADHGNCDEMVDPITGEPHTQHTTYPVPCLVIDEVPWRLKTGGGLHNVAPTVLQLMGLKQPEQMTGRSLLLKEITYSSVADPDEVVP